MQRTKPPFRADHVGSLLRPAALKDARAKHARKEIADAQLKEIEDREIEKAIKKQEEIGLKLATDGEFRRSWWHFDFFKGLKGVELIPGPAIKFHGVDTKSEAILISGKVDFAGHPHLEHFKFLKAHTKVTPKMTIPAPSTLPLPPGPQDGEQGGLSRPRCVFRRCRHDMGKGDPRLLRRGLPLPAARRYRLGDDVRPG